MDFEDLQTIIYEVRILFRKSHLGRTSEVNNIIL